MAAWQRQAVRALQRVQPLRAHALIETALRELARERWSDPTVEVALEQLMSALQGQAQLSVFGHVAARFDVLRCLRNLLRMDLAEESDGSILQRPIGRPIFITGLPRSGSTFLHSLLALDPRNVAPRSWQMLYPFPLHGRSGRSDPRRARVARQLALFRLLAPGLSHMHPLSADAPQECTEITGQTLRSLRFDTVYYIPAYRDWLDGQGHEPAYRFHRRFLQHLDAQGPPGRQWVLKSPDHVFALDALRKVYPDAPVVMLHRDPLKVIASVAKLTEMLRRPFTLRLDRAQIGREVCDRWADGAARMMAVSGAAEGILHLHYADLVGAPLHAVRRVYGHCGLTLSSEAEERMRESLRRAPRGGYGVHQHSLEAFGLDPLQVREQFVRYMQAFEVQPERTRATGSPVFTARPA